MGIPAPLLENSIDESSSSRIQPRVASMLLVSSMKGKPALLLDVWRMVFE